MVIPNPDTHPSRQVERIREILVGRQLENVERRLEKLETRVPPMPTEEQGDVFMLCLEVFEKRHNLEIQEIRDGMTSAESRNREEIHRLAQQIQTVARERTPLGAIDTSDVEQRLGRQIQDWQIGLSEHIHQRETFLIREFRNELQKMRDWVATELARHDSRRTDPAPAVHESLTRLAAAAREFAEMTAQHAAASITSPAVA